MRYIAIAGKIPIRLNLVHRDTPNSYPTQRHPENRTGIVAGSIGVFLISDNEVNWDDDGLTLPSTYLIVCAVCVCFDSFAAASSMSGSSVPRRTENACATSIFICK